MIKCPSCGQELEDHAKFCINCGYQLKTEPTIKSERVRPDDTEDDGRMFGRKPYYNHRADFVGESKRERTPFLNYSERRSAYEKAEEEVVRANPKFVPNAMMRTLSSKMRSSGIVLVVGGIFQVIYGFAAVFAAIAMAIIMRSGSFPDAMGALIAIAVGCGFLGAFGMISAITNLTTAGKNFRNAKKATINPKGLSESINTSKNPIGMIIANILCGGVIGVIGAVMYSSARGYALANMKEIEKIEAKYN